MRLIKKYKGYLIKEYTKRDSGAVTIGDLCITDKDNNMEYDDAGDLRQAMEMIDGLVSDRKNNKE